MSFEIQKRALDLIAEKVFDTLRVYLVETTLDLKLRENRILVFRTLMY